MPLWSRVARRVFRSRAEKRDDAELFGSPDYLSVRTPRSSPRQPHFHETKWRHPLLLPRTAQALLQLLLLGSFIDFRYLFTHATCLPFGDFIAEDGFRFPNDCKPGGDLAGCPWAMCAITTRSPHMRLPVRARKAARV
ncbi:hypothetical protein DL93DRAFT_127630 [Clavulina sp. PMI_390]|nr:hypothetical protein DL93DRAFT_127630 [Clavulina sp. PMI_390]